MSFHEFLLLRLKDLWEVIGLGPLEMAAGLWTLLGLFWIVLALDQKRTSKREPLFDSLLQILVFGLGTFLIFSGYAHFSWLKNRFVPEWYWIAAVGVVLTAGGVALAMWARSRLGANWSGTVSIRKQHELVRTGPYRWMRHPIYSGVLLGMAGTTLVVGEVRGLVGLALMAAAFYAKAHKEESWLNREFGAGFEAYANHTGMFLPRFSQGRAWHSFWSRLAL